MDDLFFTLAFIDADNWQIFAVIVFTIVGGITVFEKIDSIRHRNKQSPPNHEVYMTIKDSEKMEKRLNTRIDESVGGYKARLDVIDKTLQEELKSINRSLGRLEGKGD